MIIDNVDSSIKKWNWMMDWCKKNHVSPANNAIWKMAEEKWIIRNEQNY